MIESLKLKVSKIDQSVCQQILECSGAVDITFDSIVPEAVAALSKFDGESLSLTTVEPLSGQVATALNSALDILEQRREKDDSIHISLDLNSDHFNNSNFAHEALPLLRFADNNAIFTGVDFRGSVNHWPEFIQPTFVEFLECIWDIESLEALQNCSIEVLHFNLADQFPDIVSAVGRIWPDTRLEVTLSDPTDIDAIEALVSETNGVKLLLLDDLTIDGFRALAKCEGTLELCYGNLPADQRALLGQFQAEGLEIHDGEFDEAFLSYIMGCRASWISLVHFESNKLTAAMARLLVQLRDCAQGRSLQFSINSCVTLTRRAKEILTASVEESGGRMDSGSHRFSIRW